MKGKEIKRKSCENYDTICFDVEGVKNNPPELLHQYGEKDGDCMGYNYWWWKDWVGNESKTFDSEEDAMKHFESSEFEKELYNRTNRG